MNPDPIAVFDGQIVKIQTMADGSPRFVLGAGENANQFLSAMAKTQADHRLLKVIIYDYDDWMIMAGE